MRWYMGDPHFGHSNIIGDFVGREYATIEEHDADIIDNTNACVAEQDELFILGDYCWANSVKKPGHWRNRIKCRKMHLIWGNHDKDHFKLQFSTVDDVRIVSLPFTAPIKKRDGSVEERGQTMFLSHYPHAYWPSSHYGSLHIYGHMHDQREATLDAAFPGRRSMDVGVDTAYRLLGKRRPFSEAEIVSILMERPGHDDLNFYRREKVN